MNNQQTPTNMEALPEGWFLAGSAPEDYVVGADPTEFYSPLPNNLSGGRSGNIIAKPGANPSEFGTLMQHFKPVAYLGKRLRMTCYLKWKDVTDDSWVGAWMRVDYDEEAEDNNRLFGTFDNMQNRKLKDFGGWEKVHIVLDVPKSSTTLAFGVLLSGGKGQAWIDEISFEVVPETVPVTAPSVLRTEPINLSF